jgi:hypothetical protein
VVPLAEVTAAVGVEDATISRKTFVTNEKIERHEKCFFLLIFL